MNKVKHRPLPKAVIYKFTPEKIEEFRNMPIRMRLLWLEEANRFVSRRFPGYKTKDLK